MVLPSNMALLGILQVIINLSIFTLLSGVAGIPLTLTSSRVPNAHPPRHFSSRVKRWISSSAEEEGGRLSPIIFLPGTGGSQLEARMGSFHLPPKGCPKVTTWYRLWLDVMYIFTGRSAPLLVIFMLLFFMSMSCFVYVCLYMISWLILSSHRDNVDMGLSYTYL